MCCLVKWLDLNRGRYNKCQETQAVWSFQFSVCSNVSLLCRGVVLLCSAVAPLRRGVPHFFHVAELPGAAFAASQLLMASSRNVEWAGSVTVIFRA